MLKLMGKTIFIILRLIKLYPPMVAAAVWSVVVSSLFVVAPLVCGSFMFSPGLVM